MPGSPDFPFAALPRLPANVKEVAYLMGSDVGSSTVALTGSVDDP